MAKSRKDAKRQRRAKRIAERESRFERHAAMVAKRSDDPRFPQVAYNADGSRTISLTPEAAGVMKQQLEDFRQRFGRDPHADEPVFFDPDAPGDVPVPLPATAMEDGMRAAAASLDDPRLKALALASADVGYMVSTENVHMFSAHEVEAFENAVLEHLSELTGEIEDVDDQPEDIVGVAREHLLDAVAVMLSGEVSGDVPRDVLDGILTEDSGLGDDETGALVSALIATALGWLVAARESGVDDDDLNEAANWVNENLGGLEYVGPASVVASALWGKPSIPAAFMKEPQQGPTLNDLHELLGQDLMPAMLWLCTGLVATTGGGDPDWLETL